MAEVLVIGAGVVGLGTAALLATDGHHVTVIERDPAEPPAPGEEAWASWQRRGVNQFRLPHYLLCRFRSILDSELPAVAAAIEAAGGLRLNPVLALPERYRGPQRADDEDFGFLTGRRPVVESAMASVVEQMPGVSSRRGVAVGELLLGGPPHPGLPHVVGVRSEAGEEIRADLVVDCSGRRSALPRWMEQAGARPPAEETEDSGFAYYARHFRSTNGTSLPAALGPALTAVGTISSLALPADNGTWGIALVASAQDKALAGLRRLDRWSATVSSLPLVAHWLEGEPIEEDVVTMSRIEDRYREFVLDGLPVASGLVAVGDAWACSNPTLGRGASIGMLHAVLLRERLRDVGLDEPFKFVEAFHQSTAEEVYPWFEWTRRSDRHRRAEIEAQIQGEEYRPDDAAFELEREIEASPDPDCMRANVRAATVLRRYEDSLAADPALAERARSLGSDWRSRPVPGPSREQLVALAAG